MSSGSLLLAALAALVGGAINSIAGGGSLVTFPILVAIGLPPLTANTTNTMALWPGAFGSLWGYRRQFAGVGGWVASIGATGVLGGLVGAWLLLTTGNDRFEKVVPFLVLGATGLFLLNGPLTRWLRGHQQAGEVAPKPPPAFLAVQFLVGIYGGYFGAGIGILTLGVLGLFGLTDIHKMNALKVWGALAANLVAALLFAAKGAVVWPVALIMAGSSLVGGYVGSRLAQRVGQAWVRRSVVAIGLGSFIWLLVRAQ